jgi:hypothetical protein
MSFHHGIFVYPSKRLWLFGSLQLPEALDAGLISAAAFPPILMVLANVADHIMGIVGGVSREGDSAFSHAPVIVLLGTGKGKRVPAVIHPVVGSRTGVGGGQGIADM